MPLDYEYGYTIEPPKPLDPSQSQWNQMYQQFLENGVNLDPYTPAGSGYRPPAGGQPPTGGSGTIEVPAPGMGEANPTTPSPGEEAAAPTGAEQQEVDTGVEDRDRGPQGTGPNGAGNGGGLGGPEGLGTINQDPHGMGGNPLSGMSDAALQRLLNMTKTDWKDWKTWAALLIPGATVTKAGLTRLAQMEMNRRIGEGRGDFQGAWGNYAPGTNPYLLNPVQTPSNGLGEFKGDWDNYAPGENPYQPYASGQPETERPNGGVPLSLGRMGAGGYLIGVSADATRIGK